MPYGRGRKYSRPNRHGRRAAMARRIQRAYRRRRFRNNLRRRAARRRRRPTVRGLARSVRNLYQRDDKKFTYTRVNNALISGGPATGQQFQGIYELSQIPYWNQTDPTTGNPFLGYQSREEDSATCNLRNIRLHMTIHATGGEAYKTQKCYVALIKTRFALGSATGIQVPNMTDIWDYTGLGPGNLLAPWELFRNTQGSGANLLQDSVFKILKKWEVYLQPQEGETGQSLRLNITDPTATPAVGTIVSAPQPAPPATLINHTYAKNRPSEIVIKHTHKCLGAKLMFNSTTSSTPTNVKYFLVACGNGTATDRGFRLNVVAKVNFVDE